MPRQVLERETAFLNIDGTIKAGSCRRNVRAWLRHFGSGEFSDDLRMAFAELRNRIESERSVLTLDRSNWVTVIARPGEYADSFTSERVA